MSRKIEDEFKTSDHRSPDVGQTTGQVIELPSRGERSGEMMTTPRSYEAKGLILDNRFPIMTYSATADEFCTILYVSPQVENILGYSQEQYMADPVMWRNRIHPEDRKRVFEQVVNCYGNNEPLILEYRMISRDGQIVWLRDEVVVVKDTNDNPLMLQGLVFDISKYKHAEQRLRKIKSHVQSLLANLHEDVLVIDGNFRITDANKAFLVATGHRCEEVIGRYCYEISHGLSDPCMHSGEECKLLEVFETGKTASCCHRHIHSDGHKVFVDLFYTPLKDESGNISHVIRTERDVTDRIKAFESLRKSEESLRGIFDHIPAMVFIMDRDERILTWNGKFARGMGYRSGLDTLDLKVFHAAKKFWRGVARQVIDSGEPTSYVQVIDRANGDSVYFAERMQPIFGKDGKVSRAIALVNDITREVKREAIVVGTAKSLPVNLAHESDLAIIGESKAIKEVLKRIEAIAATETTVLITGESGTGKELAAEAIHSLSNRSRGPLIKVNCAALPESIIESELFGHVRGAFTSAVQTRIGRFEAANKGTIFLDEIGEISPAVQLRLLRVLDERTVEKVGDYKPIKVDVRIIAATNQDLGGLVDKGKFRKDLYYRLRVFNVHTPSLRERPDDIPLLAAHFLGEFSRTLGRRIHTVSSDGMKLLLSHSWPGNIRELMNVIESVCAICAGERVESEHLMQVFEPKANHFVETGPRMEMEIREALRATRGNKARAAKLLGIARRTLYRRMKRYGIVADVSQ
jgi:PAS domain S-box-containing protein